MLKNYLTVAIRNLWRNKTYAIINIAGLAVGMAACVLVLLYVRYELTYDRSYQDSDRMYRLLLSYYSPYLGQEFQWHGSSEMVNAIMDRYPAIEQVARVNMRSEMLLRVEDKAFYETNVAGVTPTFFDFFSIEPIEGNPAAALEVPGMLVITESMARKYFGGTEVIGETITTRWIAYESNDTEYTIGAVIRDLPVHSQLNIGFIVFTNAGGDLYVKLVKGTDPDALAADLTQFLYRSALFEQWEDSPRIAILQPISKVHLNPNPSYSAPRSLGTIFTLYSFGLIGLLVLFIAGANYVNISVATLTDRLKELAIRRTVGGERHQIMLQIVGESLLTSLLAMCAACVLVYLTLPAFGAMLDTQLPWMQGYLLLLAGIAILSGILGGAYPAYLAIRHSPVEIFQDASPQIMAGGSRLRRWLVVGQFTASIVLIIAAVSMNRQMDYMVASRLEADESNIIVINNRTGLLRSVNDYEILKTRLKSYPNILQVTAMGQDLGNADPENAISNTTNIGTGPSVPYGPSDLDELGVLMVGFDCIETLDLDLMEGRDFRPTDMGSAEWSTLSLSSILPEMERIRRNEGDAASRLYAKEANRELNLKVGVIINQSAANLRGLKDSVGQYVEMLEANLIGIVEDFHYGSLHRVIEPVILRLATDPTQFRNILVRSRPGSTAEALRIISDVWKEVLPDVPLIYTFLDEEMDAAYRGELGFRDTFNWLAGLVLFLGALGLFGLASLSTTRRTKEIGIRKVVGASVTQIVTLLSKEFLILVVIANVIAWPIAWYAIRRWLQDFAYRIDLSWWLFMLVGLFTLIIALATVSWQTIRAATANPVESIRYE